MGYPSLQLADILEMIAKGLKWWSRRESNPRPLECHSSALPTELRPHASSNWVAYNVGGVKVVGRAVNGLWNKIIGSTYSVLINAVRCSFITIYAISRLP